MRKVVVTVAPTGGSMRSSDHPHLPTQPEQIAEDVARCAELGASVAALHARRLDDAATCDERIYRRINGLVRERCDVIVNNSTGGGIDGDMVVRAADGTWEVDWSQRLRGLDGGADVCTLDAMTFFAAVAGREVLMKTPPSRGRELAEAMRARGIKPEWEAFAPTHLVQDVATLVAAGYDEAPHVVNLVLGLDTVFQGAMPYTPRTLTEMVALLPPGAVFTVSAAGPRAPEALAHALLLGGHVRVGLEDRPFAADGRPRTNAEAVAEIVALIGHLGMEPATPDEARALFGLSRTREPVG
jgi:3-keto-5-aminohexanoate cleavage enzyme